MTVLELTPAPLSWVLPHTIRGMDSFRCGHLRSPENTAPNGKWTACRICVNRRGREKREANPELARASAQERMTRYRRRNGIQEGHRNARKVSCPQGHEYAAENTYLTSAGVRQCKKCRRVRSSENHARHRERHLQQRRDRYQAEREVLLAEKKAWALANPEKVALTARIKRQRKRAAGTLTATEWRSVLDRHGHLCLCCGSDDPATIDHVVPLSRGGSNTIDNVQPLCNGCNMRKATKTIDYRPQIAVVG